MLHTAEIDMANSVTPDDVNVFLDNAAWAICSTCHTVLNTSSGADVFGCDMLFDVPFMAEWHKIGAQRQSLTNHGSWREEAKCICYSPYGHKLF
jgi:hypothetical protein